MTDRTEQVRRLAEEVMGWDRTRKSACTAELQYWWAISEDRNPPWNPFANPAHTEMVMDRMRELGWEMRSLSSRSGYYCQFSKGGWDVHDGWGIPAADWRTAVCLAVLEAINAGN